MTDHVTIAPAGRTWGPELAAALAEAQGKVTMVAKDGKNEFHRYRYTTVESLIEEARGALAPSGLSLLIVESRCEAEDHPILMNDKGKPVARVIGRLVVEYMLLHKSGEHLFLHSSAPVILEAGKPEDKAEAAARTYDLGYTLRGLLLLSRGDADGGVDQRDDTAHEPSARGRREYQQPAQAEDKPTATELEAQGLIAKATTLEMLEQAKREVGAWVEAGQVVGRGRGRLSAQIQERRAALQAALATGADPATGELPLDRPSSPRAEDWGDRATVITKHVADAKTIGALNIADAELAAAQKEGMPAALVAPIGAAVLAKRARIDATALSKAARDAQSAVFRQEPTPGLKPGDPE